MNGWGAVARGVCCGLVGAALFALAPPALAQELSFTGTQDDENITARHSTFALTLPEVDGGTAPYAYALMDIRNLGAVGLTFTPSTRVFSGEWNAAGGLSLSLTYTATDSATDPASVSLTFNLIVAAQVRFPTAVTVQDQTYASDVPIDPLTLPLATGGYSDTPGTPAPFYELVDKPTGLEVTESGGMRTLTGAVDATVAAGDYPVAWRAFDSNGASSELSFTITVPTPPTFNSADSVILTFTAEYPVESQYSDEADRRLPAASGGTPPYTYAVVPDPADPDRHLLPPGLTFDSMTRIITGTPDNLPDAATLANPDLGALVYLPGYRVTDQNGAEHTDPAAGRFVQFLISRALEFGDSSPSNVENGDVFPYEVDEAIDPLTLPVVAFGTGNNLTYPLTLTPTPPASGVFAATSPFAGLTFASGTRVLTGALTGSGGTLKWRGTDDLGAFVELTFRVTTGGPTFAIADAVPPQTFTQPGRITPLTLPAADVSAATLPVTYTLTGAGGGALPAGLTFTAAADGGVLSGTPTGAGGDYPLTYTATDSDTPPLSASLTFTVTVVAADPGLPSVADQTFPKGETVALTLPLANGGTAPIVYTLAGNLPSGLTYNAAANPVTVGHGGTLDGTPDRTFSGQLTYTATDSESTPRAVSATFTLTIAGPAFGALGNTNFTIGQAVDLTLPGIESGATGAVTYTLNPATPETLEGLTFTLADPSVDGPAGMFSGTPTRAASEEFVISATDGDGDMGMLTFTITVRPGAGVNEVLLPEIARAIADQTVGAITRRIDQARGASSGAEGSLGGQSSLAGLLSSHGMTLLDGEQLDLDAMLANSHFVLPLSARTEGGAAGGLSVWGSGDYRELSDEEDELSWDGDLISAHLGMDTLLSDVLLGGVALSLSRSRFNYEDARSRGRHEIELSSVYPYLSWTVLEGRLDLWATAGFGSGELEIHDDSQDRVASSDVEMWTVGAGLRSLLIEEGGTRLRFKGDVLQAQMELEGSDDIGALEVDVSRLRLAMEVSQAHSLAGGGRFEPLLELGLRHDGGDGDESTAMELGAGVRHVSPALGLTLEGRLYTLVGRDDYSEWGLQGLVELLKGIDGRGLSLRLSSRYGADASPEVQDIWMRELELQGGDPRAVDYNVRVDARLGYGLSAPTSRHRGLLTPYTELNFDPDATHYHLGLQWQLPSRAEFTLKLSSEQRTDNRANPAPTLNLNATTRF